MFNRYTTETLRDALAQTDDPGAAELIRRELVARATDWLLTHELPQLGNAPEVQS